MRTMTETDIATTLLRARLRRERRLRAVLCGQPADLLHEATRTVDRLEDKLTDYRSSRHDENQERLAWGDR